MNDPSRVRESVWRQISPRMVELGLAELQRLRSSDSSDPEIVHWVFGAMRDRQVDEETVRDLEERGYWEEYHIEHMFPHRFGLKKKSPGRSKGGFATAAKTTPDQRSERGRKGAEARWGKK